MVLHFLKFSNSWLIHILFAKDVKDGTSATKKNKSKAKAKSKPKKKVKKALKEALPAGPAVAKKTKGGKRPGSFMDAEIMNRRHNWCMCFPGPPTSTRKQS